MILLLVAQIELLLTKLCEQRIDEHPLKLVDVFDYGVVSAKQVYIPV